MAQSHKSKHEARETINTDMGSTVIQSLKPTINLMQNCDLPPPIKLVYSPDEMFHSSVSKFYNYIVDYEKLEKNEKLTHAYEDFSEHSNKIEIMKALRLSQTRARKAERKLKTIYKEKETLSNLLVDESLRLYACHQLVNLLDVQILKLKREEEDRQNCVGDCTEKTEATEEGISTRSWSAAMAFCVAIAGMGFAIGCTYLF